MSTGQVFIGEMIDSFGTLVTLFFTTWFTTFVSPILTIVAGLFGLTT
jgi:hypothetical protein